MDRIVRHGGRQILMLLLALALMLTVAACGGDGDEDATDTTQASGGPDPGTTLTTVDSDGPSETFEPQTFTVDQEFWHSGFHVTVLDGVLTATEDEFSGEVDYEVQINASFENLLDEDSSFFAEDAALLSSENAYAAKFDSLPTVPSGLSSNGTLAFAVDEAFDLANAQLVIGGADVNQAFVPLGTGELISLEPSEPSVSGSIEMELVDLTFKSAALQADYPSSHQELDKGKLLLTLILDATSRKSGNWNVFPQDFALILPDGSGVTPDSSQLGDLPGSEEGLATPDLSVAFLINDPPAGDYTLRLTVGDWFVGDDGVNEGTFEFSLP